MSYSRSQLQNFPESSYNIIRQNYQNRGSLKTGQQRPQSYNQYINNDRQNYRYTEGQMKRNSIAKIQNLRKQFHDVIDLCKGQNQNVKGQLNNVVQAQKDIYNMFIQNQQQLQRVPSHQSIVQHPQTLNQHFNFIKKQQFTPIIRKNNNYIPQSICYIPQFSQVATKQQRIPTNMTNQKFKKQQQSMYIPVQDQYYPSNDQTILKNSFNMLKKSNPVLLNDDAIRLIQQIQRKAFQQIQKVRKQKIELMQRLNQQIRNTNQQRKKNIELQNKLLVFRSQYQRPDGIINNNQNIRQLQLQNNRLHDQLKRTNQMNNHLKIQLSQRGAGVSGIQQLLRQGQLIRQDTLRLLRSKESDSSSNQRLLQLESQLAQQRAEKKNALSDIKILRQRIGGGSRTIIGQSKVNTQPYVKSSVGIKSSNLNINSNKYQQMMAEMKRITGY